MNGKIKSPTIFRRKRFAQVSAGECVITAEQQKEIYKAQMVDPQELRRSIIDVLDEMDANEVEIDEKEVAERIAELYRHFNQEVPPAVAEALRRKTEQLNQIENKTTHTCTQCGAPIKDGKCEYCGTIYN